jgi:hypothetical protein
MTANENKSLLGELAGASIGTVLAVIAAARRGKTSSNGLTPQRSPTARAVSRSSSERCRSAARRGRPATPSSTVSTPRPATGRLSFDLAVAAVSGRFQPVAELRIGRRLPPELDALRFNPIENTGGGMAADRTLQRV